jgi:hypothetical protein
MSKVNEFSQAMSEISHDQELEYKKMRSIIMALRGCLNDIETDIRDYSDNLTSSQKRYLRIIEVTRWHIQDLEDGKIIF